MLIPIRPKNRKITEVTRVGNTLSLRSEHGMLELEPITSSIVRVIYRLQGWERNDDKPGVILKDTYSDWIFEEGETEITLKLPEVIVKVNKESGAVRFTDPEGRKLFTEREKEPKEFEVFDAFRLSGEPQKTRIIETADGKKEVLEDPQKIPDGKNCHIRLHFEPGDEALYGLGQQEKGFASLRGRTLYLHQGNRKIAIPMFVSTAGYGVLLDTYSPFIFHDMEGETYLYTEADRELRYYLIAGDMNRVVSGYRHLTGKAALLPKWAFGYVQSKERYENQEQILEAAKKSRTLGIGMDCIVLDWFSWENGHWGQKSYDKERFPDPEEMIRQLHAMHVHFMISVWPTMAECTADHKEFAAAGPDYLLPACTAYNPFKKEARELFFDELRRTHYSYGTDAWWCDSSEPFTPEWNHLMRPEEASLYREYCEEAGLRMSLEKANAFALYHAMSIYEGQRDLNEDQSAVNDRLREQSEGHNDVNDDLRGLSDGQRDLNEDQSAVNGRLRELSEEKNNLNDSLSDLSEGKNFVNDGLRKQRNDISVENRQEKRVCNLTRSAYTGQQRYGTIMWSGDTDASWDTYRDQIAIGLHFSASGLPFWTNDIGAFFVKKGVNWYWDGHFDVEDIPGNPGYAELYTRWYQYAAFLPMFRAHGTEFDRELWNFDGPFYDAMLEANRLRYRLMPYIYSEAGKVWLKDRSLIRFLAFDYTADRKTWGITDQFLFGESLMVCPVTEPMYYDETGASLTDVPRTREVYLPEGNDWYDFYTGNRYAGGQTVIADAPLEKIPVFVKAGSLIPMTKEALSTEEQTESLDPTLWKQFGENAVYELYEDAGDGYGYERGEYTLREIHAEA